MSSTSSCRTPSRCSSTARPPRLRPRRGHGRSAIPLRSCKPSWKSRATRWRIRQRARCFHACWRAPLPRRWPWRTHSPRCCTSSRYHAWLCLRRRPYGPSLGHRARRTSQTASPRPRKLPSASSARSTRPPVARRSGPMLSGASCVASSLRRKGSWRIRIRFPTSHRKSPPPTTLASPTRPRWTGRPQMRARTSSPATPRGTTPTTTARTSKTSLRWTPRSTASGRRR
mmetsp:Transcript_10108/g.28936  ORF Transcript_10108/g.28936 Transcript_10108/m.28936 type:complete len:228 (+) Transcript_10108:295-978(+)